MPTPRMLMAARMLAALAALWLPAAAADPVAVRFTEGVTHGFLALRTLDGALVASGDLLQIVRHGAVESRMVFRFKDGSVMDETVLFTQDRVFAMQSYRLLQKGSAFKEDTEMFLERASGKYRLKTTARDDGRESVLEGTLDMPADTYNGMVLNVAKNLQKDTRQAVHLVAFTPGPRLIELELTPAAEHAVLVGELTKSAIHYVFKARLPFGLKLLATLTGRLPPDSHAWIVADDVPAFVRFEGPLYSGGPVWRIELTSPRWPESP